jgi:hypothetical protein
MENEVSKMASGVTNLSVNVKVAETNGRPPAPARKPSCEPRAAYDDITKVLQGIAKARSRPLFALISDSIDADVVKDVHSWKKELRSIGESPIDILVQSPGGSLTACYLVARLFSRYLTEWEALVPDIAYSGATLICLGSSNIIMSEISQLGPVDPQVASKHKEKFFATERQSPLEAFEAVKYLREFAVSSLDALMEVFIRRGITPQRALEFAMKMSTDLAKPILERIEPYDLGAFSLDNTLAITYAKEIARPADTSLKTQRKAYYRSLIEQYPAHEFAIDLTEAQSIKMKAALPDEDVDELFDIFRAKTSASGLTNYIGLVPPTAEQVKEESAE